jgi:hypothetical protein
MRITIWIATATFLSFWQLAAEGVAASPQFLRQFRAEDARPGDDFGRSVALDGRLAIVGAPQHDVGGEDSGAAYIFDVLSGQQLQKLVPDDGAATDAFGISVSIHKDWAIVGALDDDDAGLSSGSAYIFDVRTGQQLHKLTANDASAGDQFGISVDLDEQLAIVGAHLDGPGSAYLFEVTTGQQLDRLRADDAALDDRFGVAVAIHEGRALIGARYDQDLGISAGAAYLFDTASGEQLHKIKPHDGARGDRYGMYVDLHDGHAIVTSRYDDDAVKSSGSAYIYDASSGEELYKIVPDDTAPHDHFGSAISVSGHLAVVGAVNDERLGFFAGSAYLFDVNIGRQLFKFTGHDTKAYDQFGQSVAIDGEIVLIGASMLDYAGAVELPSGKAYVYLVPEPSGVMLIVVGLTAFIIRPYSRRQPSGKGSGESSSKPPSGL